MQPVDTYYKCIICDGLVDQDVVVAVFLNPPDRSWEMIKSTPYMLNISPCCGERACVEAAWEQVKRSTIGQIDLNHA